MKRCIDLGRGHQLPIRGPGRSYLFLCIAVEMETISYILAVCGDFRTMQLPMLFLFIIPPQFDTLRAMFEYHFLLFFLLMPFRFCFWCIGGKCFTVVFNWLEHNLFSGVDKIISHRPVLIGSELAISQVFMHDTSSWGLSTFFVGLRST